MSTPCLTASAVSASRSGLEPSHQKIRSGLHSSAILRAQSRTALFFTLHSPSFIRLQPVGCVRYPLDHPTQPLIPPNNRDLHRSEEQKINEHTRPPKTPTMFWGIHPIPTPPASWQTAFTKTNMSVSG